MRIVCVALVAVALTGCSRHPFEKFFGSGEKYLAARRYPEAIIQFQNAARADPQSIAVQMKLGEAYAALDQPLNAAVAFQRACNLDHQNVTACVASAAALLAVGDYSNAAAEARLVLAADRVNLDAQLILGSALAGVRRFAEAEERIQAAIATAPRNARAYQLLGDVQRQRGNAKGAESSLQKAIQLGSASPDSHVSLAQLYFDIGRADDAARELRAALDTDPNDLSANRAYASYLVETNRCNEAEPYWKNVASQSTDASGALALADFYILSGRPDDALRVLGPLTTSDEGGAARTRMASILYDRGDRAKAVGIVDSVLAQDPSNVNGLLLKARIALAEQDTARARELAHQAATIAPNSAAVREMLAALTAAQ